MKTLTGNASVKKLDGGGGSLEPIVAEMQNYYRNLGNILTGILGENWQNEPSRLAVQADGEVTNYYIDGLPVCSGTQVIVGDSTYAWGLEIYE